jgi:hypothetical protein
MTGSFFQYALAHERASQIISISSICRLWLIPSIAKSAGCAVVPNRLDYYSGSMENLSFAVDRQPLPAWKSVSISCFTSEKISLLVRNLSPVNWCSIVPSGTSTSILIMVFMVQSPYDGF